MPTPTCVCFKCGLMQDCKLPDATPAHEFTRQVVAQYPRWFGKIPVRGLPIPVWLCKRCRAGLGPYPPAGDIKFLNSKQVATHYNIKIEIWKKHSSVARNPLLRELACAQDGGE